MANQDEPKDRFPKESLAFCEKVPLKISNVKKMRRLLKIKTDIPIFQIFGKGRNI